jgi:hypothetical protein
MTIYPESHRHLSSGSFDWIRESILSVLPGRRRVDKSEGAESQVVTSSSFFSYWGGNSENEDILVLQFSAYRRVGILTLYTYRKDVTSRLVL